MGPVVTINSSTLVNKGLEIIEAHYLFDIPYAQIEAVIHPQSIVHSFVEFIDGSTIAQASPPNMKGPIAYALSYPDRLSGAPPGISLRSITPNFPLSILRAVAGLWAADFPPSLTQQMKLLLTLFLILTLDTQKSSI
jgi:hypothetical protein